MVTDPLRRGVGAIALSAEPTERAVDSLGETLRRGGGRFSDPDSGHLHDYGEWVRLEDVETGEVLIEVTGELDEKGKTHGVERKIIGFGDDALHDLDFTNLPAGELHVDGAIGRHAHN